jgi:uncharacterized integral membrane protein
MSSADPHETAGTTDPTAPEPPPPTGRQAGSPEGHDPLRGSRTSHVWVALTALAIILLLLIVFIAQNTGRVAVRFLGWTWHPPLAVAILGGVVAGMLLAVVSGSLRIWQLHRRVRRTRQPTFAGEGTSRTTD